MTIRQKKIMIGVGIFLLIAWSILLFFVDLEHIVVAIGVENLYAILFITAVIAGTSFLTSAAFYAVFSSCSAAGLDPLFISIVGGIGMTIGDSLYFIFSQKIGAVMHESKSTMHNKIHNFFMRLPRWSVLIFLYIYAAFTPLPNDALMITLGMMRYRVYYVLPVTILGNITLLALVAYGIRFTFF